MVVIIVYPVSQSTPPNHISLRLHRNWICPIPVHFASFLELEVSSLEQVVRWQLTQEINL